MRFAGARGGLHPSEDIIRHVFGRCQSGSAHWDPAERVASRKKAGGFPGEKTEILRGGPGARVLLPAAGRRRPARHATPDGPHCTGTLSKQIAPATKGVGGQARDVLQGPRSDSSP